MKNKQNTTMRLVFSAMMVALGTVLSLSPLSLPFGGSVTFGSMVPLVIICQIYGMGYGLGACFAYSLIQLILGAGNLAYAVTFLAAVVIVLFDYVLAFSAMSLSGVTRRMKNKGAAAAIGAVIGCFARYILHLVSGALVWGEWASLDYIPAFLHGTVFTENPQLFCWTYSVFYNAAYMIPETILTAVVAALLCRFVKFDKLAAK